MYGPHLLVCRIRPASGSPLPVPSVPPGAGGRAQALRSGCLCPSHATLKAVSGRLTLGDSPEPGLLISYILSSGTLEPGGRSERNPGLGLLRRRNWCSEQSEPPGRLGETRGSGRAEGRPAVSFFQLFVNRGTAPPGLCLGPWSARTSVPTPGLSVLSCQPCLVPHL